MLFELLATITFAREEAVHSSCDAQISCQVQPLVPVIKSGAECPFGFLDSKNSAYCVPISHEILGVIPVYSNTLPKKCPPGYRKNRGYCQATSKIFKNAIPKIGDKCPKKYYSNNEFCFEVCE